MKRYGLFFLTDGTGKATFLSFTDNINIDSDINKVAPLGRCTFFTAKVLVNSDLPIDREFKSPFNEGERLTYCGGQEYKFK